MDRPVWSFASVAPSNELAVMVTANRSTAVIDFEPCGQIHTDCCLIVSFRIVGYELFEGTRVHSNGTSSHELWDGHRLNSDGSGDVNFGNGWSFNTKRGLKRTWTVPVS